MKLIIEFTGFLLRFFLGKVIVPVKDDDIKNAVINSPYATLDDFGGESYPETKEVPESVLKRKAYYDTETPEGGRTVRIQTNYPTCSKCGLHRSNRKGCKARFSRNKTKRFQYKTPRFTINYKGGRNPNKAKVIHPKWAAGLKWTDRRHGELE